MSINVLELSLDELKNLRKDIALAIGTFEARAKAEARAKLEAQAKEMGFKLAELLEDAPKGRTAKPPKYRNPENPGETWSGRGRKPGWLASAINAGAQLDDFLITRT